MSSNAETHRPSAARPQPKQATGSNGLNGLPELNEEPAGGSCFAACGQFRLLHCRGGREPPGSLTPAGGAAVLRVRRQRKISRSGERARGFGGEPKPCVHQSPRSPTNWTTTAWSERRQAWLAETGSAKTLRRSILDPLSAINRPLLRYSITPFHNVFHFSRNPEPVLGKHPVERQFMNVRTCNRDPNGIPGDRRANPEGWQGVAGGRSGQWGNDRRKAGSHSRAPRRGARPGPEVPDFASSRLRSTASGTPRGVQDLASVITRRSRPPCPPATSGYPLATLRVGRSRMAEEFPTFLGQLGQKRRLYR